MRTRIKKIFSILLAASMLLFIGMPINAAYSDVEGTATSIDALTLCATSIEVAKTDVEQQVMISFYMEQNAGIGSFDVTIVETLDDVVVGTPTCNLTGITFNGNSGYAGGYKEAGNESYATYNNELDGYVLFTVPVMLAANFEGECAIGFEIQEITDKDGEVYNLSSESITSTITVTEAPAAGGEEEGGNDATDGYVATLTATTLANQGDTVQVTVNVNKPFNSAKIVLSYDATVLKFNDNGGALADGQTMTYEDPAATFENKEADGKGTITILDFGSAFAAGAAYTLTFTSQKGGNTAVEVDSAGFSTAEEAETEDLIPVTSSADANVVVKHKVTFNGNEDFVVPGEAFEGTIPNYDPANNTYVVKVNDAAQENLEIDAAGNFSIPNVIEELTITFEATPNQYTLTWNDPQNYATDRNPDGNTVSYGQEITFKVPAEQLPDGTTDGYSYVVEVTVKVDETTTQTITPTVSGQTYTISGDKITGDITITVTQKPLSATQTTITVESPDATVKYGEEIISSAITVTKDGAYELTVVKENNYDYTVMQYNGEDTQGTELEVAEDGTFTVAVTDKPVRIVVTRTLITTGLEVSQYLGVSGKDFWLVKMTGTQINDKTYTLTEDDKTNNFFWSEEYGAYCYLIIRDTGKQANDIKTEIEGAITLTDGTAIEINYDGDVNKSGSKDVNDAQLVWNMYNADYTDFTDAVTVEKFLRADMNGDEMIDTDDAAEVITIIQAPTAGN